jgi:hypothetical protein
MGLENPAGKASLRKRRYSRLTFREPLRDQVTATHDVQILDLSVGGARVEHTAILRPGSTCHLRLPLKHHNMTVVCQVVWSRAVGRAEGETRGTGLLFQSGLEFSKMTAEARKLLVAYLDGEGTPPPDLAERNAG